MMQKDYNMNKKDAILELVKRRRKANDEYDVNESMDPNAYNTGYEWGRYDAFSEALELLNKKK